MELKLSVALDEVLGSVFSVIIEANKSVDELRKAIIKKKQNDFKDVERDELQLFLAKTESGEWLPNDENLDKLLQNKVDTSKMQQLNMSWKLNNEKPALFGSDVSLGEGVVHVLVKIGLKRPAEDERVGDPKRLKTTDTGDLEATLLNIIRALEAIRPNTLRVFEKLPVSESEFQLDNLSTIRQSGNPIVMTPELYAFWEEFGEFPPFYFVRVEECVFWKVIKKLLFSKDRVVMVGSPGVGKSCFLMLMAFYLACIKKTKVLVIRHLKTTKATNAVVYFDGQGSYARLINVSCNDLFAIRRQVKGSIVLVDGYDQVELSQSMALEPFHFLATSCQFDAKADDSSHIVVLPAWRESDLMNYAKLTNWVVKTGLSKTITVEDSVLRKLVKEQHFFSGGSLRQFCQTRKEATLRAYCPVNRDEVVNLVYNFRGGTFGCREDRLRGHYITDCHKEQDYQDPRCWKLFVDSGYVLSKLGPMVDMNKMFHHYQYAKSVGAGFHSITYKQLFHNAVRGSIAKQQPVVVRFREGSQYEKLEIQAKVDCCGEDEAREEEASCYRCLSTLKDDTYWYPGYQFFPFIDAVATCEAFPIGSKRSETIVAYIQMTTRSGQKIKGERLGRLNGEMDKNQLLKDKPRAFVVVVPDAEVCENFQLQDEPGLSTFPTLVGYFTRTNEN